MSYTELVDRNIKYKMDQKSSRTGVPKIFQIQTSHKEFSSANYIPGVKFTFPSFSVKLAGISGRIRRPRLQNGSYWRPRPLRVLCHRVRQSTNMSTKRLWSVCFLQCVRKGKLWQDNSWLLRYDPPARCPEHLTIPCREEHRLVRATSLLTWRQLGHQRSKGNHFENVDDIKKAVTQCGGFGKIHSRSTCKHGRER